MKDLSRVQHEHMGKTASGINDIAPELYDRLSLMTASTEAKGWDYLSPETSRCLRGLRVASLRQKVCDFSPFLRYLQGTFALIASGAQAMTTFDHWICICQILRWIPQKHQGERGIGSIYIGPAFRWTPQESTK